MISPASIFLKIDCEGSEYDIVTHAGDDALAQVQRFTMEWHQVGDRTDILRDGMVDRLSLKSPIRREGESVGWDRGW
jgi:Methyltransferase FkbM domain